MDIFEVLAARLGWQHFSGSLVGISKSGWRLVYLEKSIKWVFLFIANFLTVFARWNRFTKEVWKYFAISVGTWLSEIFFKTIPARTRWFVFLVKCSLIYCHSKHWQLNQLHAKNAIILMANASCGYQVAVEGFMDENLITLVQVLIPITTRKDTVIIARIRTRQMLVSVFKWYFRL